MNLAVIIIDGSFHTDCLCTDKLTDWSKNPVGRIPIPGMKERSNEVTCSCTLGVVFYVCSAIPWVDFVNFLYNPIGSHSVLPNYEYYCM